MGWWGPVLWEMVFKVQLNIRRTAVHDPVRAAGGTMGILNRV